MPVRPGLVGGRRWRLAITIGAFVGVLVAGFLLFADSLEAWLGSENGLDWLREQGALAGIVAILLIASDLLLPIPVSAVNCGRMAS